MIEYQLLSIPKEFKHRQLILLKHLTESLFQTLTGFPYEKPSLKYLCRDCFQEPKSQERSNPVKDLETLVRIVQIEKLFNRTEKNSFSLGNFS